MKSEIIFSHTTLSRNRYRKKTQNRVVIFSDTSDMNKWPYVIKKYTANIEFFSDRIEEHEIESINITPQLFNEIKQLISKNTRLRDCSANIQNEVMDSTTENFHFECDEFCVDISGLSILGCGYIDKDKPEHLRSDNYYVLKAYEQIADLLEKNDILYVL